AAGGGDASAEVHAEEAHAGRERVEQLDVLRVARAGVRDGERVGEGATRGHRTRGRLRDANVGPRGGRWRCRGLAVCRHRVPRAATRDDGRVGDGATPGGTGRDVRYEYEHGTGSDGECRGRAAYRAVGAHGGGRTREAGARRLRLGDER